MLIKRNCLTLVIIIIIENNSATSVMMLAMILIISARKIEKVDFKISICFILEEGSLLNRGDQFGRTPLVRVQMHDTSIKVWSFGRSQSKFVNR